MIGRIAAAALLLGAIAFGLLFPRYQGQVDVGTGYAAKQLCSCIFVAGRSLDSCRADLLPEMDAIDAEPTRDGDGIRAWVPGISERFAYHDAATGCTLH